MAARFWVGGTADWTAINTASWAASTGGAGGQTVPGSGDTVTFDANSGGGTVTVNTTVNVTSITCGAHTGTLDFSANDNNVTVSSFSGTGSGTRTLNLGDGTWTMTGVGTCWTIATATNLTFNANASVLTFTATSTSARTFASAALTYATVSISANSSGGIFNITAGASTFGTLNIAPPQYVVFQSIVTLTITNAFTWTGTSTDQLLFESSTAGSIAFISTAAGSPTMTWAGVREITFGGGATFTATNSFNFLRTSGITITVPVVGSGSVGVIGS